MEQKKRIHFHAPLDLANFAEREAKKMGVSLTGYMNMLIYQEKKQNEVIRMSNALQVETTDDWKERLASYDEINAKIGKHSEK